MLSVGVVSRYESILIVVIPHQGQDIAAALLDTFVAPALAAYGHVSVVSADFDLGPLADKIALSVYACVDDGFASAIACRLNFVDGIGNFEKAARALE